MCSPPSAPFGADPGLKRAAVGQPPPPPPDARPSPAMAAQSRGYGITYVTMGQHPQDTGSSTSPILSPDTGRRGRKGGREVYSQSRLLKRTRRCCAHYPLASSRSSTQLSPPQHPTACGCAHSGRLMKGFRWRAIPGPSTQVACCDGGRLLGLPHRSRAASLRAHSPPLVLGNHARLVMDSLLVFWRFQRGG